MNKLIFLLALIPLILGVRPSLKNALRRQVVIDFKNAITPLISRYLRLVKLPDVHEKVSGFHIDVTNGQIQFLPINANLINIEFVPNSNDIKVQVSGLYMKGTAHIKVKWSIISKSMNAEIDLLNFGVFIHIRLISAGGKPNIGVIALNIQLAANHVHIKLHGDIVVKIVEFVVNLLKGSIVKEVVKEINSQVPQAVTIEVNKLLNTLPTDLDIAQNMMIRYGYPYASYVRADYLFTGISGFIYPKGNPSPPPVEPPDMPEFDGGNPKGVQFFFSDYILRSSTNTLFAIGFMTVSIERDMLGHHLKMICRATAAPTIKFENVVDIVLNAQCDVDFDRIPKNHFAIVTTSHVNMNEHMRQAVIFFNINVAELYKIEYKGAENIDIKWFKDGINQILEVVKQVINAQLGQRGIPLPSIRGIDYADSVQYVRQGYIFFGVTPVFHITAEEDQ